MSVVQIRVPDWVDRVCAWPTMVYRKCKYGYDFRRIYLGDGEWTIVEPADYYRLGHLKWHLKGSNRKKFYAVRDVKTGLGRSRILSLHREIMNEPKGVVDHKNGCSLDNRRANLRAATSAQNAQNRPKQQNTSSQFIGVCFHKRMRKWTANISYKGRKRWLGTFDSEIDAAKAYDRATLKYYGEFAKVNFTAEPNPALRG